VIQSVIFSVIASVITTFLKLFLNMWAFQNILIKEASEEYKLLERGIRKLESDIPCLYKKKLKYSFYKIRCSLYLMNDYLNKLREKEKKNKQLIKSQTLNVKKIVNLLNENSNNFNNNLNNEKMGFKEIDKIKRFNIKSELNKMNNSDNYMIEKNLEKSSNAYDINSENKKVLINKKIENKYDDSIQKNEFTKNNYFYEISEINENEKSINIDNSVNLKDLTMDIDNSNRSILRKLKNKEFLNVNKNNKRRNKLKLNKFEKNPEALAFALCLEPKETKSCKVTYLLNNVQQINQYDENFEGQKKSSILQVKNIKNNNLITNKNKNDGSFTTVNFQIGFICISKKDNFNLTELNQFLKEEEKKGNANVEFLSFNRKRIKRKMNSHNKITILMRKFSCAMNSVENIDCFLVRIDSDDKSHLKAKSDTGVLIKGVFLIILYIFLLFFIAVFVRSIFSQYRDKTFKICVMPLISMLIVKLVFVFNIMTFLGCLLLYRYGKSYINSNKKPFILNIYFKIFITPIMLQHFTSLELYKDILLSNNLKI